MDKRIIALIVGLVIVVSLAAVYFFLIFNRTQFEIVSHNGVLGYESIYPETRYNYTVYVEIKHVVGDTNTITIYCELTREDLTKITKQQTITLLVGESKIIEFFFSNDDLLGKIPTQYKIWGASE